MLNDKYKCTPISLIAKLFSPHPAPHHIHTIFSKSTCLLRSFLLLCVAPASRSLSHQHHRRDSERAWMLFGFAVIYCCCVWASCEIGFGLAATNSSRRSWYDALTHRRRSRRQSWNNIKIILDYIFGYLNKSREHANFALAHSAICIWLKRKRFCFWWCFFLKLYFSNSRICHINSVVKDARPMFDANEDGRYMNNAMWDWGMDDGLCVFFFCVLQTTNRILGWLRTGFPFRARSGDIFW